MPELTDELLHVRENALLIHTEEHMAACFDRLAEEITANLAGSKPLLLPVMLGGIYLCGQLMQRLNFPLEIDYLHATRYRNSLQGDHLMWLVPPPAQVAERTILVIDDILDQGVTLAGIVEKLKCAGAAEVQSVVMTTKICPGDADIHASYSGVEVPDKYVFGCGMDYRGYWRNLPGIYALADD